VGKRLDTAAKSRRASRILPDVQHLLSIALDYTGAVCLHIGTVVDRNQAGRSAAGLFQDIHAAIIALVNVYSQSEIFYFVKIVFS
jgi:hypothetical protein